MGLRSPNHALLHPVRLATIARHLGRIAVVLSVLIAIPAVFAYASGDWRLANRLMAGALLPSLALAACALIPAGARRPLQTNEALVVSALAFMVAAALFSFPLTAGGLSPLDAWFEAVSGVTTTGLTLVTDPEQRSDAFLFTRAWMQWFGGLGMVVVSLALAFGRPADMRRLADAAGDEEHPERGVRVHARRMLAVYGVLTLLGVALVWLSGLPVFDALIHTLAAISTGGFSGLPDSLASLDAQTRGALMLVAVLGALPIPLFYRAYARGPGQLWRDPELKALVVAVVLVALLLWWLGRITPGQALTQAVFAQTGTGFSSLDVGALDPAAKWTLILSMVTGGGVGSTAGGVKLLRVLILIRVIQLAVLRVQMPRHAVVEAELGGRPLEAAQIEHALLVLLLFPLVILVSWLPFLAVGYAPLDALFEVVSAVGTVGLSTGITGPDLEPGLKLLLSLDMLLGRLEILALVVLVYPGTWYKRS